MANKCQQCGLVNWDYDEVCKRCNASLNPAAWNAASSDAVTSRNAATSRYAAATPSVYTWYVVYCILMALLYLSLVGIGIVFMLAGPDPEMSDAEAQVMGVVFIIMGLVFAVPYAAAPFLPRKSWVWVFGLVLICIGLSSACLLPVCIPLLIFWLKPEMKDFYGRNLNPLPPPPPPQWS